MEKRLVSDTMAMDISHDGMPLKEFLEKVSAVETGDDPYVIIVGRKFCIGWEREETDEELEHRKEGVRQLEEHSKAARKEKFKELVQEFDADLKKLFDASRNVVDAHDPINEGSVEHNLKDALEAFMS